MSNKTNRRGRDVAASWTPSPVKVMLALTAVILARLLWIVTVSAQSDIDIVDVGYAKYLGNRTFPDSVAYLGIPYAEPPVEELRFKATVPLNKSRVFEQNKGKVVDATKYPNFCVQGFSGGGPGGAGVEDCLKVNIYAPVGASRGSKLPVLVYIHGGGYTFGNPRNWPFDHWVHQSPNVIIVSVYYRLNSFGFLSHPSFGTSSSPSPLGDLNPGFLDQIEALKWLKRNIEAFGGDAEKVTINGESAGGSSIELHLVANEGEEQLFSQAIAQSVYRTPLPTPEQQLSLFNYYASQAGCGTGDVDVQMGCLRNANISALARAQDAARSLKGYNSFHPVVDKDVIPDIPTKLITDGKIAHVPIIVGATSNETLSSGSLSAALSAFFPAITQEDIAQFSQVYTSDTVDHADVFRVATGESELRCARTIIGSEASKKQKAWTYRYNQANPTSGSSAVDHAAENWMMFLGTNTGANGTTTFTPMNATQTNFASELIAYWLSFVRAGDPNTFKLKESPSWSSYGASQRNRMVLQQGSADKSGSFIEIEPEEETKRCAFVAGLQEREQN